MPRAKRNNEDPTEVAQSLQSKRTKTSTKRTYSSKISTMTAWLALHYPDTVAIEPQKMILPLPKDAILSFFGHICSPADACDRDGVSSAQASTAPLSASCIWGYRSALVDVYRSNLLELDPQLDTELRRVLEGYEKVINNLKKRGLMKINEGKRQLKINGFELVAVKLMKLEPKTTGQAWSTVLFGWSFFVLMWNLMSRADSIDTIMLQHMEWVEDCLIVEEQGHKGDQTGADKFGKHVYANPYQPSQCAILALAVHIFSCPERSIGGKQQLFIGSDSKDRFGRILRRVVGSLNEEELRELGCSPEDIGTHSLRKGSSSYALGQVNGPTPVSVYLRMGQSLGRLKDRYIHFGEGADQLCGRMIAGLPFDSDRFGVLPPHFPPLITSQMTAKYWDEVVSGFSNYPRGVQSAFPFLLASLIFHEDYLRQNLCANHPIFKSRAFSSNSLLHLQRGTPIISIGTSPVCSLKATGIPAHLAVAQQVNRLKDEVANLRTSMETTLPSTIVRELRQHFVVNGVTPISVHDLDSKISGLEARMTARFSSALRDIQMAHTSTEPTTTIGQHNWRTWSWNDGQICHNVPKDWEFPARANAKLLWNLWFFGDNDVGIRPYRLLNKQFDIMPKHQMRHTRVRIVMEHLEQLAKEAQLYPSDVSSVSMLEIPAADKVFDTSFAIMLSKLYTKTPKRAEDLSCGTLYNRLCQYRKKHSS